MFFSDVDVVVLPDPIKILKPVSENVVSDDILVVFH
jgi:hypothetical protein